MRQITLESDFKAMIIALKGNKEIKKRSNIVALFTEHQKFSE